MLGETILVRSLSRTAIADKAGTRWQYHSRSDRHSKIACWGILLDLLRHSPLLRSHATSRKVVFGINHEMTDFTSHRKKNLDLVICIPRSESSERRSRTFASLADQYQIALSPPEADELGELPGFSEGAVGDVLLAVESKACMTAHVRAAPRLFDELSSAFQCINGSAPAAIAVGHAIVNTSPTFVSTDLNKGRNTTSSSFTVSRNPQPQSALKAVDTIRRLTVRGHAADRGYDAIGITTIDFVNDGTEARLGSEAFAMPSNDAFNYERMVLRLSGLYDARFHGR